MRTLKTFICVLIVVLFLLATKIASADNNDYDYLIKVKFSEFKLILIDVSGKELASFPVALPKITPKLPIEGQVKKIERNPHWYPTEKTRKDYLKKNGIELPRVVPPNHPKNALGAVKFIIAWETTNINPVIMLHGTNEPESIKKRVTRGCIRLLNEDGLALAKTIEGRRTKIRFEL